MNARDNTPKRPEPPVAPEVLEEVLRRRHALRANEPTVDARKALDDLIRRHTPAQS
jgi:hypothetical protein